jgi:hypothetical protein
MTQANLPSHRLTVKRLPTMIQPLKDASAATCPAL